MLIDIIITIISGVTSSFLLKSLNKSMGIFKSIQEDLSKLSKKTKSILSFCGHLLAMTLSALLTITFRSEWSIGCIILGFLMALVDTCFRDNLLENYKES